MEREIVIPKRTKDVVLASIYNLKHNIKDEVPAVHPYWVWKSVTALHYKGTFEPITADILHDEDSMRMFMEWRIANDHAFPRQTRITLETTHRWFKDALIGRPDRILFWVNSPNGERIGTIGLGNFNFEDSSFYVESAMRGSSRFSGAVTAVFRSIMNVAFYKLGMSVAWGNLFADNQGAIRMNLNAGMKFVGVIPLKRVILEDGIEWQKIPEQAGIAERYFLVSYCCRPTLIVGR